MWCPVKDTDLPPQTEYDVDFKGRDAGGSLRVSGAGEGFAGFGGVGAKLFGEFFY